MPNASRSFRETIDNLGVILRTSIIKYFKRDNSKVKQVFKGEIILKLSNVELLFFDTTLPLSGLYFNGLYFNELSVIAWQIHMHTPDNHYQAF